MTGSDSMRLAIARCGVEAPGGRLEAAAPRDGGFAVTLVLRGTEGDA